MAVCPSQSIVVNSLEYARDFFALPAGSAVEMHFSEMIGTRRAIRVFKEQPVPKELLERVVQAITFAPPGFTPLKTEVVVIEDTAVIRQALPEMIKVYDGLVKAMDHPVAQFFVRRYEADIYIALTYGLLAAHALGLGATAIDLVPPAIQNSSVLRELFSIPDSNVVVASMILGYPKHRYQRGIKRELKSVTWI